jgi:hypothetical protein
MNTGRKTLTFCFTTKEVAIQYSKPIYRLADFIESINNLFELMINPVILCAGVLQSIRQNMRICKIVRFYDDSHLEEKY